ncbi:DUF1345 domain-containing protein [Brooklawnia cerclae]
MGVNLARIVVMALVGACTGIAVSRLLDWPFVIVAGWGAGCLVYVVWVWVAVWGFDAERTRSHARREEPVRAISDGLILSASLASLVAVLLLLLHSSSQAETRATAAIFAVTSVALSWVLVHTLYALRYAREYYSEPTGGISFNQAEPPQYSDFAYLAFCLGMTFQISDTNLSSTRLRKIVLSHTLLSYLFNTVVIAATVNLVINLATAV